MEFGKVANLEGLDFSLPALSASSRAALGGQPSAKGFQLRLGGTGWSNKGWLGTLYPKSTRPNEMLSAYMRQLDTIELNTTHYQIPRMEVVADWLNRAQSINPHFRFCPKMPQFVSHSGNLLQSVEGAQAFIQALQPLRVFVGALFMQLPPTFAPVRSGELLEFLQRLRSSDLGAAMPIDIELRHEAWFAANQSAGRAAFLQELGRLRVGLVLTDVAGRRDVCHAYFTLPRLLLRFVGNNGHESDERRLRLWANRLAELAAAGLEEAHFFVHQPTEVAMPASLHFAVSLFRERIGCEIRQPQDWRQEENYSLF